MSDQPHDAARDTGDLAEVPEGQRLDQDPDEAENEPADLSDAPEGDEPDFVGED